MKVRQFLGYFKKEDLDKEIIMSSDAEGNGYHNVDEVWLDKEKGRLVIYPCHDIVEVEE